MTPREEYEAKWRDYRSAGPYDWRASHHGEPDPEFATLCAEAERVGADVELVVSGTAFGGRESLVRKLAALHVRHPHLARLRITVRFELGDSLRTVAARARQQLEAA